MSSAASEQGTESPLKGSVAHSNADTELTNSCALSHPCVVLVVGGGLSGLACCLALTEIGCEVHVYEESSTSPSTFEHGVPWDPLVATFCHRLELDKCITRTSGRQVLASDGETAVQDGQQQQYVSWDSLRRAMVQRIPAGHLHTNCKVVAADLTDPTSTAVIELESGERICGHLIIAADGMNSTLRNQLLPQCQPTYAGYLAWRGVARVQELSAEVQHLLADKATMYKGPYLHAQVHPLAAAGLDSSSDGGCSSSDAGPRLAWTWYNNQVQDELPGLLLDQDLEVHAHGVALGALNPAVADAVVSAASGALPPPLAELVSCSVRHMGVSAISDMVLSGCVISNKVAFVGKAGSVVRPHCCSSAHKAVLDATSLADALRASKLTLEKALPRWEQLQVRRTLALCHEAVAAGERMQGFTAC